MSHTDDQRPASEVLCTSVASSNSCRCMASHRSWSFHILLSLPALPRVSLLFSSISKVWCAPIFTHWFSSRRVSRSLCTTRTALGSPPPTATWAPPPARSSPTAPRCRPQSAPGAGLGASVRRGTGHTRPRRGTRRPPQGLRLTPLLPPLRPRPMSSNKRHGSFQKRAWTS